MRQGLKKISNNGLAVDVRRVLGGKDEYRIALTNQVSSDESFKKLIESIPGGELNISLSYQSSTLLDAKIVVDSGSQSAEGICHLYIENEILMGLVKNGKLSIDLAVQEKRE